MKFHYLPLAAAAIAVASSVTVLAGSESGGGGDNPPVEANSAWFLGSRPIHYCVDIAPKYPFQNDVVLREIERAFQHWKDYIVAKKVNEGRPAGSHLILNLVYDPACTSNADLTIELGTRSPRVLAAKENYYNPTALAFRESYDPRKGWGRGLIWISDPASFLAQRAAHPLEHLRTILLHEIGHVLGNGDSAGSIMDSSRLNWHYPQITSDPKIDQDVELYACDKLRCAYEGAIGTDPENARRLFAKFAGRTPKGDIRGRLAMVSDDGLDIKLTMTDELGSVPVHVAFDKKKRQNASSMEVWVPTFKVTILDADEPDYYGYHSAGRHLEPVVAFGTVSDAKRKIHVLTIDLNMRTNGLSSPVALHYIDGTERKPLFMAKMPL